MSHNPLVSVIIGFLNAEKFLQEAIESVMAQTYCHWELLLVDDGSTDASTEMARRYATHYHEKISYLEHEGHQNRGVCAARNLGLKHARGAYIAILDADDVWLPHKLDRQVEILETYTEAVMVCGASEYWKSWTGKAKDAWQNYIRKPDIQTHTVYESPRLVTLCYPLGGESAPCPSNILLRREIFETIGGFEEDFKGAYQLFEDQAFLIKVYLNGPVFVSDECWDRYRLHGDSCMAKVANQVHTVRLFFLNWLTDYLTKQDIKDPEIWQALDKAFWPYRHPVLHGLINPVKILLGRLKLYAMLMKQRMLYRHTAELPDRNFSHPSHETTPNFGNLRRLVPIRFGYDRGLPIDRYYIENFLARQAHDIRGHVLEIGDDAYTRRFGGDRVTARDVLHVTGGNPAATIVADLTCANHIPSATFDCIILTQTLQFIYDVRAALRTIQRILKPCGVVLATFPGISQITADYWGAYQCWSFSTRSAQRLFEEVFPKNQVTIEAFGNVLVTLAFLHGLAVEELTPEELQYCDCNYEFLITTRAVKPEIA